MAVTRKISSAANSQLTISNTAVNLLETLVANGESAEVRGADYWTFNIEDKNIRMFWDGNTPTAALGMPVFVNGTITVNATADKINFIRSESADAKVNYQTGAAIKGIS